MRNEKPIAPRFLALVYATVTGAAVSKTALAEDFSLVVLPDTQMYSHYAETRTKDCNTNGEDCDWGRYAEQAIWIKYYAPSTRYNIKQVIHLGDVVHHSNDPDEWEEAYNAHAILHDAGIPFTVVPGNHDLSDDLIDGFGQARASDPSKIDYFYRKQTRRYTEFRSQFPASFQSNNGVQVFPWIDGCDNCTENNYSSFTGSGTKYVVINLEFAPSKDAVCWANRVIAANSMAKVIVVTHAYQNNTYRHSTYPIRSDDDDIDLRLIGSNAQELFDELIRRNSNIFLVLSGHRGGSELVSQNIKMTANPAQSYSVHQILTDFQTEWDYGLFPDNEDGVTGNGWLRRLAFVPASSVVRAYVVSTADYDYGMTSGFGYAEFTKGGAVDVGAYPRSPKDHTFSITTNLAPPSANVQDRGSRRFGDRLVNTRSFVKTDYGLLGGPQQNPSIATGSTGTVVVWQDDEDGNGWKQIRMRGFSGDGCESFSERTVNKVGAGDQIVPKVAATATGDFVVVWQDDRDSDRTDWDILAAKFNSNGERLWTTDIVVNANTQNRQTAPSVAINSAGEFVVVWQETDSDGNKNIEGRLFDTNGAPLTGDFVVVGAVTAQTDPTVAMDDTANDRFVVAWEDWDSGSLMANRIKFRGMQHLPGASDVSAWLSITQANAGNSTYANEPSVAMRSSGDFAIAWHEMTGKTDQGVRLRGWTSSKGAWFAEQVTSSTGRVPVVTMGRGASENILVAWSKYDADALCPYDSDITEPTGVYHKSWDIVGKTYTYYGKEIRVYDPVNGDTCSVQHHPAAAIYNNKPVFVWEDDLNEAAFSSDIVMRGLDDIYDRFDDYQ